ncbi:MAG: lipocalin family protein [Gammaproteobacteria bacterium]|nr:lipocalin family protein [Gammaproteobacteria bacterium]
MTRQLKIGVIFVALLVCACHRSEDAPSVGPSIDAKQGSDFWPILEIAVKRLTSENNNPPASQISADQGAHSPFPQLHQPSEQWDLLWIERTPMSVKAHQQIFSRLRIGDAPAVNSDWAFSDVMMAQTASSASPVTDLPGTFNTTVAVERVANDLAGAQTDGNLWVRDQALTLSRSERCSTQIELPRREGGSSEFVTADCGLRVDGPGISAISYRLIGQRAGSLGWLTHSWGTLPDAGGAVVLDRAWLHLESFGDLQLTRRKRKNHQGPIAVNAMIFRIGAAAVEQHSGLRFIDKDEQRSKHSGYLYPTSWQLQSEELDIDIRLQPLVELQEWPVTGRLVWRGAVIISGSHTGEGFVLFNPAPIDAKSLTSL